MFDDRHWTVDALRDGIPHAAFEEALDGLLREMQAEDAESYRELAESLIGGAPFTPEQAAAWRERFAARRAELLLSRAA